MVEWLGWGPGSPRQGSAKPPPSILVLFGGAFDFCSIGGVEERGYGHRAQSPQRSEESSALWTYSLSSILDNSNT